MACAPASASSQSGIWNPPGASPGGESQGKERSLEDGAKEARASAAGGVGSPSGLGAAYPEIVETCVSSWNGLEGEGTQYEYWNGKVT